MNYDHLDLFSGIGGFAIAAERAGWKTIGFSEIDPYASAVLKKHWPDVPNFGDIRNLHGTRCDLITGGFPCQPFSCAGKRRGKEDDRHLWPEMLRVVSEARPNWVLAENVPGIVNMELDRVLSDLETLSYSTLPVVIPACAVDARHRRDRVWIVAHRNEPRLQGRNSGILSECSEQWVTGAGHSSMANPKDSDGGRTDGSKYSRRRDSEARGCHKSDRRIQHWLPEPELGRVANGIPNRTHRLRCLGNAIVPQVAEVLLRFMFQIHTGQVI